MKNYLLKEELAAVFRNKKLLIPIIAILFIPVLYTGMFLWAFWDPYDKLQDLPVAVVNEDKGAASDGEQLKLGDELVAKLKDSGEFNFKFVDKTTGYRELKNQKYYMLIEIPENFSENATTLLDENPQKLNLVYVPNESYNFLSAQIGGTAIEKIKASISEKITETYAETMFEKAGQLADGIEKASEGAGKLTDGADELSNGSTLLHDNLAELAEKSIEFNNGMAAANSGSREVASGAQSLANGLGQLEEGHKKLEAASEQLKSGNEEMAAGISQTKAGLQQASEKVPEMAAGTERLQAGAETLSSSLQQWQAGAAKTAGGAKELNAGTAALQQQLEQILPMLPEDKQTVLKAALKQLNDGSAALSAGTEQLAGSAGKLSAGAGELSKNLGALQQDQQQLQIGINQLAEGSERLETGANKITAGELEFQTGMVTFGQKLAEAKAGSDKLAGGSAGLSGGLNQLADGSTKIAEGSGNLEEGANKLADGTEQLANGSSELAGKLADGADAASSVNGTDKTYNMIAEPVKVKNEKINKVPNYGTGFAPYFLSLGLFVGALLLSIVFPLREPATVPRNGISWFTSKFAFISGIGIIQALLADVILLTGLGLKVESIPLFILLSIVTSITFMALIQLLVTAFGDPGRFLAIIVLVFQLTTSAGTFPLELIPGFLQQFNAFLPMTYSVQGFKAVISSGDYGFMWQNTAILLTFMLLFAAGTIVFFTYKHKRQFEGMTAK